MYDAIIIGGGASGLAAACALAGWKIALLEKQPRVGRKLLSTGNGRCNLTNLNASPERYHGARGAAARALELCPPGEVLRFFELLGLPAVADDESRVYPMSNQAASVLDALRLYAAEHGCEILTECAAESIVRRSSPACFRVCTADGRGLDARRVLVFTGGLAAPKLGACGDGYRLLEAMGHTSTAKMPAIAPLRTPPEIVRGLKGQRADCAVTLWVNGRPARSERGEILFSETGVSVIAAMQLARSCSEAARKGARCELKVNFLAEGRRLDLHAGVKLREAANGIHGVEAAGHDSCLNPDLRESVEQWLMERARRLPDRAMEDFLNGVVSRRLGQALAKSAGIEPLSRRADSLPASEIRALAAVLTQWTIPVTGVQGFDQAQVTAGGVALDDFDWDTMQSRRAPGLYAAGEVLDVDGDCGGYNLQWAWASALIAARSMRRAMDQERGGKRG